MILASMAAPLLVAKNDKTALTLLPALANRLFGGTSPRGGKQSQGILEAMSKSAARSIGSELGRQVLRGILGSVLGGRKR
jgi:uncharacterized protein